MKSKFSRRAGTIFSLFALLLLLPSGRLAAQSAHPTPSPAPPRPKAGYVRFWNATPPATGLTLDLVVGTSPEGRVLHSATPANFYANYASLPPGQQVLRVFRNGDRQNAIKTFTLPLLDRSYFTLLATSQPNGSTSIEIVNDTPDPTKPPVNRLTVRQFCPDTTAIVTTTGNHQSDSLAYGQTQTLEGLPNGVIALALRATKGGVTGTKTWDTQADFRVSHHVTMFIVNDLYGRIRARVSVDGPSPEAEAEAAEEAARAIGSKQ